MILNLYFNGDNLIPGISAIVPGTRGLTQFRENTAPTTLSLYLREMSKKVKRGLAGQLERGFATGSITYGYRTVPVLNPSGKNDAHGRPALLQPAAGRLHGQLLLGAGRFLRLQRREDRLELGDPRFLASHPLAQLGQVGGQLGRGGGFHSDVIRNKWLLPVRAEAVSCHKRSNCVQGGEPNHF